MRKPTTLLPAGLLALLAGCGGGGDRPRAQLTLDAAADGSLRFASTSVRTTPGPVRIAMGNPSNIPHAIGIRGGGVEEQEGETVGGGGESSVEVTVEPGRYTLFCPVAGHEAAGMVATLEIR